jgi:hypothetical protein
MELSENENYLVESLVKVREARDEYSVNALISDSLFTFLDSTIDTLRIANTIRELNLDPDRWVLIFRKIEEKTDHRSRDRASDIPGPDAQSRGSK